MYIPFIETLRDNTRHAEIDINKKYILLVHPHWYTGKREFRQFLKSIDQSKDVCAGYTVECIGHCTMFGIKILDCIKRYLERQPYIDSVTITLKGFLSEYLLTVKFKN